MVKRIFSMILALALLLSLAGCSWFDEKQKYEMIERPVEEGYTGDVSQMTAVPKPEKETSKTLQWIDMDVHSNADLMMMETLQGNVNRIEPSMYIIHDSVIEGVGNHGSRFWFDQLDEQYTGEDAFTKVEYTDPYAMLVANQDHINGCIIYHERLTDAAMASRSDYAGRYSDMALLNLTLMMCGQYDAVALNYLQYHKLKTEYGLELKILGDTTQFMEKDEDGNFSTVRDSRAVWERVYKYALRTFADTCSDKALAHNAGFQAGNFDYFVANDLFIYNRIFSAHATETEKQMEVDMLAVSKPNTPVFGCWYLQADEGAMVPVMTANYKYMVVSYESFNLSWSSGLPYEELDVEEEKLTLDPTKNYIAFSFTEGDNNSYLYFRVPAMFESEAKGEYPIGWTIAATTWELNPNMIRYFNQNWSDGDGIVTPEAGVGYVYHTPPAASQDEFFAISDEYLKRTDSSVIRVLQANLSDALTYAEKMQNLEALSCGYLETGNYNYNNDLSHFLFRDTAVFTIYDGREATTIAKGEGGAPGFYLVSLAGWNQDPVSVTTIMEELGENYVVVTPSQLADLYKQYYAGEFKNVTQTSFQANMTRTEMGFLYKASSYSDYDAYTGSRMADGEDYFIYKFDLAAGVKEAVFDLVVSGNYQIEVSNDYLHWYVMAKDNVKDVQNITIDASSIIEEGKPLYIRFGDATVENAGGVDLYWLQLTTDKHSADSFDVDCTRDNPYLVDGSASEMTSEGRKGEFVYRLPVSAGISSGDLMIRAENVTVSISTDGKTYEDLPMHKVGYTWYAQLSNLSGDVYLRIKSDAAVSVLRFSPTPAAVPFLSFSPVSNAYTDAYLLSLDDCKVLEDGITSNRAVVDDAVMVYRFVTTADVTEARLMLTTSGIYKLSVSNDGKTYTELYEAQAGGDNPNPNTIDITEFAAGGKQVYVKFEASKQIAGKAAKIQKLRLLTNLTSDALLDKIDKERDPNATVIAGSAGEIALLDESLSSKHFLYENKARCLQADQTAHFVYRYDTNSAEFFEALGIDQVEVTKLRISYNIGNAYKISVSGDGVNWVDLVETTDPSIQSASNRKDLDIKLTDYMINGVVYVKVSHSSHYIEGKTHDGLIWNTRFFIN
jgi:hypothetical protein